MGTLIAEAEVNRAHLESSAGILGQQQQLEEAARKQVQSPATLPTRLFACTGMSDSPTTLFSHRFCWDLVVVVHLHS